MQAAPDYPDVRPCLPAVGELPKDYYLYIDKWHFREDRMGELNRYGTKKLLTMDVNFPQREFAEVVNAGQDEAERRRLFAKEYPCIHSCPGCLNNGDVAAPVMSTEDTLSLLEQAKELGLESIKFLGPGELIMNPNMFSILDFLRDRDITILIYTKGALLGDDSLAKRYYGMCSRSLLDRLLEYDNVNYMVGARSFVPELENKYIPTKNPKLRATFDYHKARNRAIERLCEAGLNSDLHKQRVGLAANPVTQHTIDGAYDLFVWGTERNMPVCITATCVSGMGNQMVKQQVELDFQEQYRNLAVSIYRYTINRGITDIETLNRDGISSYMGMAHCNQLTHGLYVHYDGTVQMCSGNDHEGYRIHRDIRTSNLKDIWENSPNYGINKFNNGCVKDHISIPTGFYVEVLRRLNEEFGYTPDAPLVDPALPLRTVHPRKTTVLPMVIPPGVPAQQQAPAQSLATSPNRFHRGDE